MVGKTNSEVKAMDAAWSALSGLEPDEQRRVLHWLIDKLKLGAAVSLAPAAPGGVSAQQLSGTRPRAPGSCLA